MKKRTSIEIFKDFVYNNNLTITKEDFETILNDDNLDCTLTNMKPILKVDNLIAFTSKNINCYIKKADLKLVKKIDQLTNLLYEHNNEYAGFEYFSMIIEALKIDYYDYDED